MTPVLNDARDLSRLQGKLCLAIGVFDGVHLGHQQVIRQSVLDAGQFNGQAVVVTFDRHPSTVVAPDRAPAMIHHTRQRLQHIESLGVDATLLIRFDKAFSQHTGEDFIRSLIPEPGRAHSVCVGSGFRFGHARSGDVSLLQKLGAELDFQVHGLAAVALDQEPVSSTRIRQAVASGNLDEAGQMLGRSYSLTGTVIEGEKVGRQLGFPTANLNVSGLVLPPRGVYAIRARVDQESTQHDAVLNIGLRPTLGSSQPALHVEAHLLDTDLDLYGRGLELSFVQFIREEQAFPSLDDLKAQISRDIAQARTLLANH